MIGKLQLTLCGAPTLTLGEQPLSGILTGKALALFIYLAVTGRPHQRDALAELLWSELPLPQARANLRYLLPDLRQIVGDYLLITPQNIAFNRAAPYWLDVEVAYTTLTAPRHTVSDSAVQAALALLQDEFLAGFQVRKAPAFMHWVAGQRQGLAALRQQAQGVPWLVKQNFPNQLTPFFGREQEINELLQFLDRADYRLLTIVGEGGVGKTRLALAVAQKITKPSFPDGVYFVPLVDMTASANLADQLATAIGQTLDVTFSGQSTPTAQLLHHLATRRLLLILDNFEQLCGDPTFVLELLQKTNAVKLLITSRRRLNVQAEYPWLLTGLPLPCVTTPTTFTTAEHMQFAGIALFVERARRTQPDFQLTGANQATVVRICEAVQGLPLGIELAAALSREYTCRELLAALQQDYAILTTTLPDFADRHRSIKSVINYSWRLLKPEESAILSRCAIFRGRFDQDAAAFVAGATLALLSRLQDQSLLHCTSEVVGRRYFALHELVRQYAVAQLTPAALAQTRERHAIYFMTKLQQAETTIREQGVSESLLQCDLDNLRVAWEWSIAQKQLGLLAPCVEALARLYRMIGFHQEAYYAFHAAITAVRQNDFTAISQVRLLVNLLNSTAEFCRYLDRLTEAERLVQEALHLSEQLTDTALQGWSYHELARIAQRRHQHMTMYLHAQQAQQFAQQARDAHLQALCLNALAVSAVLCGDIASAIPHYQAALHHLQAAPDRELESTVCANLGGAYKRNREYTLAVDHLTRAVALVESIHDQYGAAVIHVLLGDLWLEMGAYERAQATFARALRSFDKIFDAYWEAWGRTSQAHLWHLSGDSATAASECRRVLPLVQDKMPLLEHRALTYLGDALCNLGEVDNAEKLYWRSLTLQQQAKLDFRLTEPVIRLAHLLLARNEANAAQTLLEEPLAHLMQQGPATTPEPFALYLISYRVFQANGDGRANAILQQADKVLQESASNITESALRKAFLENVSPRRELLLLSQRTKGDHTIEFLSI